MKRSFWILALALMAGVVGFCLTHKATCADGGCMTSAHEEPSLMPELKWLRREFALSDAQFAQVSALHLAYRPTCEALCQKIAASRDKLQTLVEAKTQVSPELKSALEAHATLHVECQSAMLTHMYQTAALMPPEQARRYLDTLLPKVIEMPMESAPHTPGH